MKLMRAGLSMWSWGAAAMRKRERDREKMRFKIIMEGKEVVGAGEGEVVGADEVSDTCELEVIKNCI